MNRRLGFVALTGLALAATLAGVNPAHAGAKGRKNTAAVLGGVAAYSLIKGNTGVGIASGIGAAVAYDKYKDAKDDERYDRRHRGGGYRYDDGYRPRYDDGPRYDDRYRYEDRGGYRHDDRYESRYDDRYDRGRYEDRYERGRCEEHPRCDGHARYESRGGYRRDRY